MLRSIVHSPLSSWDSADQISLIEPFLSFFNLFEIVGMFLLVDVERVGLFTKAKEDSVDKELLVDVPVDYFH